MTQQQQQPSEGALRVAEQIAAAYWGERWATIAGEVRERHLRVLARMIDSAHVELDREVAQLRIDAAKWRALVAEGGQRVTDDSK